MWSAVFRKELRENRWKGLIYALILVATAVLAQALHGLMGDLLNDLGPLVDNPLLAGLEFQLGDPLAYHWGNWYGKNLTQMTTIFAVLIGMSAVAGESSRGTALFLFTRPLPRRAILSAKVAGGYSLLAGTMILTTLLTLLVARLGGMELGIRFLAGLPMALLGTLILYLLAVVASIIFEDTVKAGVAAGMAMAVLSLPGWIKGWGQYSIFRQMGGVPLLFGEPWPWGAGLVMTAGSVILYLLAVYLLDRKEFSR